MIVAVQCLADMGSDEQRLVADHRGVKGDGAEVGTSDFVGLCAGL
jgi:hypothetical protein